ncbi:hypothetical protein FB567DRAFT_597913 [Paraphoma chrysanthemicola]|uniref:Fungal N-terminal domain-containing protein n=1 Tax=Paraphoma chrysanthemicola TaxID=798071 RepID=A0A8K0QVA5_9PLEO|nr:hypothetical protein FB567DRAFT_597913 [Paraphoma chrysanthemicola]
MIAQSDGVRAQKATEVLQFTCHRFSPSFYGGGYVAWWLRNFTTYGTFPALNHSCHTLFFLELCIFRKMALEASAAIIGILAAAGQVAKALEPILSAFVHAPEHAHTILTEVKHTRTILSGLQSLFNDFDTSPRRRKELIRIDALVAALTDGVLLFSELEALIDQLGQVEPKATILIRTLWARHKSELDALVSRLLSFKISISLILSILQCESDLDAQRDRNELLAVTAKLLASNLDLANRIADLERCYHAGASGATRPSTRRPSEATIKHDISNIESEDKTVNLSIGSWPDFHFEQDLNASRVYRKARRGSTDFSFRSSIAPSHAWSTLSDISLADLSAISVIALPLQHSELANAWHYAIEEVSDDETSPTAWPSEANGLIFVDQTVELSYEEAPGPGQLVISPTSSSMTLKFPEVDVRLSTSFSLIVKVAPEADVHDLCSKFATLSGPRNSVQRDQCDRSIHHSCVVDGISVHLSVSIMYEEKHSSSYTLLECKSMEQPVVDMFMLIYSMSSKESFDFVQQYRPDYRYWEAMDIPPIMMAGVMRNPSHHERIPHKRAYDLALRRGCAFTEIDGDNLHSFEEALHELVRVRWKYEKLQVEKAQNRLRHDLMVEQRRKREKERLTARKTNLQSSTSLLGRHTSDTTLASMQVIDEYAALPHRPLGEHGW